MDLHRTSTVLLVLLVLGAAAAEKRAMPPITALAIAPGEEGFIQGSSAGVVFKPFDPDAAKEQTIPTELEQVHALAFSPDGTVLAVAGGTPAESGIIELWSWPQRKQLGLLEGHEDLVYDVAWLPGGKALASTSADRTVRVWDTVTGRCLATLRGHAGPVLALAVSPDGKWLCSGSADQSIRVWDTGTWKLARSLDNHLGAVYTLAFRPAAEGQPVLASGSADGTVRVWQPGTGRMVRIVRHGSPVHALAWNEDGSVLYTAAKDGVLRTVEGDSVQVRREQQLAAGWGMSLARADRVGRLVIGTSHGAAVVVSPSAPTGWGRQ